VLDDLAHRRDAGGEQQLAQLGEVVALLEGADREGALLRAAGGPAVGGARLGLSSVSAAFHGSCSV
jgi:hypothetical protein